MATKVSSIEAEKLPSNSCSRAPAQACCDQARMKLAACERLRIAERAAFYRGHDVLFAYRTRGCSVIEHSNLTQVRVYELAQLLAEQSTVPSVSWVFGNRRPASRIDDLMPWAYAKLPA